MILSPADLTIVVLQLLQHSTARKLTKIRKRAHITLILKPLRCLTISFRIEFKVLLLVYKTLNGLGYAYLSDLLLSHGSSKTLRCSWRCLLSLLKSHNQKRWSALRLWNSLPENLRAIESVDVFKWKLNIGLFDLPFNWSLVTIFLFIQWILAGFTSFLFLFNF